MKTDLKIALFKEQDMKIDMIAPPPFEGPFVDNYRVSGKKGCALRKGAELDSEPLKDPLPTNCQVDVIEEKVIGDKVRRARCGVRPCSACVYFPFLRVVVRTSACRRGCTLFATTSRGGTRNPKRSTRGARTSSSRW